MFEACVQTAPEAVRHDVRYSFRVGHLVQPSNARGRERTPGRSLLAFGVVRFEGDSGAADHVGQGETPGHEGDHHH
ncbi:hypothetical protein SF23_02450 [Streptomyces sp. MBRL 10]|nr:hypothetical protein SF23_02450 [Streptomyces sp. MBRL 10]